MNEQSILLELIQKIERVIAQNEHQNKEIAEIKFSLKHFDSHVADKNLHMCQDHEKRMQELEAIKTQFLEYINIEKGNAKGKKWVWGIITILGSIIIGLTAFIFNSFRLFNIVRDF